MNLITPCNILPRWLHILFSVAILPLELRLIYPSLIKKVHKHPSTVVASSAIDVAMVSKPTGPPLNLLIIASK